MSGGRLVILDRLGRDAKRHSLPTGLVTLGSDPSCGIRVMQSSVRSHHATVTVHNNQTIIRNVSDGDTLVNGFPISVVALDHGDTITLGGRSLRWEYDQPAGVNAANSLPKVQIKKGKSKGRRGRKRLSEVASKCIDPAVHLMLEMKHRASMPAGGKQVAIVQPQRRDAHNIYDSNPRLAVKPHRPFAHTSKRRSKSETPKKEAPIIDSEKSKRKSTSSYRASPKTTDNLTTKASLWIESRKTSPRKLLQTPKSVQPARAVSVKKATPLRTLLLRKAITPSLAPTPKKTPVKVMKIQAPLKLDQTKQAAILLMTGHTPKSRIPVSQSTSAKRSPTLVVKKTSPIKRKTISPKITPQKKSTGRTSRSTKEVPNTSIIDKSTSNRSLRGTPIASNSPNGVILSPENVTLTPKTTSRNATLTPGSSNASVRSTRGSPKTVSPNGVILTFGNARSLKSSTSTPQIGSPSPRNATYTPSSPTITPRSARSSPKTTSPNGVVLTLRNTTISPKRAPTPKADTSTPRNVTITSKGRNSSPRNASFTPQTLAESPRSARSSTRSPAVQGNAMSISSSPSASPKRARSSGISPIMSPRNETSLRNERHVPETPPSKRARPSKQSPILTPQNASLSSRSPLVSPRSAISSAKTPTSARGGTPRTTSVSPKRAKSSLKRSLSAGDTTRSSKRGAANQSVSVLEISDSEPRKSRSRNSGTFVAQKPSKSTPLPTPIKSALKDPRAKKSTRKTESIKFDLSNLENYDQSNDVFIVSNTTKGKSFSSEYSSSEEDITLHLEVSPPPSPRRSMHSRSSKILENSIGSSFMTDSSSFERKTLTPEAPKSKKSLRGSLMVSRVLATPEKNESVRSSRRSGKSDASTPGNTTMSGKSKVLTPRNATRGGKSDVFTPGNATRSKKSDVITPGNATRTLSPRSPKEMETYSIVDLVSVGSNDSRSPSLYNSAGSVDTTAFGTPRNSGGRKSRSTIDPSLITSSTPYVAKTRANKSADISAPSKQTRSANKTGSSLSQSTRLSKSSGSPANQTPITINSTRVSRASRSTLSDSDVTSSRYSEVDSQKSISKSRSSRLSHASPQSAEKSRRTSKNTPKLSISGEVTPENCNSPDEAGTPVLSIQSLLDSTNTSPLSQSFAKRGRISANLKRKTIGVLQKTTQPAKGRTGAKSKSLTLSGAKRNNSSKSSDCSDENAPKTSNAKSITPKGAVKLIQEAVKEKHSTAKKTTSKRSIIDNLNDSDIIKTLFTSPVKRKLSQSMTEFSKNNLLDDDDVPTRRKTRKTIALTGRTPNNSVLERSELIPAELFVSPLSTPASSPNVSGVKRLFRKGTPKNDLRNISGVKTLLRTPRTRKSIKNDLTNVDGIKNVFARSPNNSLTDVRGVKQVFAASPANDLRRVSGVKSLFQSTRKGRKTPKNVLTEVNGIKSLFKTKSPKNDLRNVSGVKKTLKTSPKNDLRDVRGVKRLFRQDKSGNGLTNLSGVEELFDNSYISYNEPPTSENLFDQLVGRPSIKSTYGKSKSFISKPIQKPKNRRVAKSLNISFDLITNNVEQWLENELQQRTNKNASQPSTSAGRQSLNKSKNTPKNLTKELQKLQTDTVEGTQPLLDRSRSRLSKTNTSQQQKSASELYSAHTLPIKKRSLASALEKSGNVSKTSLPIKKRALIHSTPVKGRVNVTANVSELGRVSPITAEETYATETSTRTKRNKASPKSKPATPKGKKAKSFENAVTAIVTDDSTMTIISNSKVNNSPIKRATRGQRSVTEITNTKKRGTALVIGKKSPVIKPATRRGKITENLTVSPKANRRAKAVTSAKESKSPVASPKATRRRKPAVAANDTTSPVVSPKATRKAKPVASPKVATKSTIASPKASRKTKTVQVLKATKSPIISPKATRRAKPAPSPKPASKSTRKGKDIVEEKVAEPVKATNARRARSNAKEEATPKAATPVRKGRQTKQAQQSPTPRKGRQAASVKIVKKPATPDIVVKKAVEVKPVTPKRKGRQAKQQTPVKAVTPRRGRKAKVEERVVTPKASPKGKTRARKVEEKPVTPKGRARKTSKATVVVTKASPKLKPKSPEPIAKTRARKPVEPVSPKPKTIKGKSQAIEAIEKKNVEKKPTRGRRTTSPKKVEAEPAAKRGRKALVEALPVLEPKTRQRKPASPINSPAKKPTAKKEAVEKPTRGRKVVEEKVAKETKTSKKVVDSKATKAQNAKTSNKEETVVEAKANRGKKTPAVVEKPAPSRKRKSSEPVALKGSLKKEPASKRMRKAVQFASPEKPRTSRAKKDSQPSTTTGKRGRR